MAIRWGNAGAGILFFCGNECLLILRSMHVEEPLTWGIPGGSVSGEDYYEAFEESRVRIDSDAYLAGAIKEAEEELGSVPPFEIFDEIIYREGGFTYVTFFAKISKRDKDNWKITLNWENSDFKWFSVDSLPPNTHFGVDYLIEQRPGLLQQPFSSENKILVDNPSTLYHGTSLTNLQDIINYGGLSPGRGVSPHRTKTKNALFYSSDFEAAMFYAERPRVILEIDSRHMKLHPDWDDASELISVDLDEFQTEFGELQIGDAVPDLLIDDILSYLDFSSMERAEPTTLEIATIGGKNYLLAIPFVCLPVNEDAMHIRPELYDEFSFSDGRPCLLSQQFLCYEDLSFNSVKSIWVEDLVINQLNIPQEAILDRELFENYQTILNLEDAESMPYTEEFVDEVIFEPIMMCNLAPKKLKQYLRKYIR